MDMNNKRQRAIHLTILINSCEDSLHLGTRGICVQLALNLATTTKRALPSKQTYFVLVLP